MVSIEKDKMKIFNICKVSNGIDVLPKNNYSYANDLKLKP